MNIRLVNFIKTGSKSSAMSQYVLADYVIIDLKRPYFMADKGCTWLYGKCMDGEVETEFLKSIKYVRATYGLVFEYDDFMIFRRKI